MVAAAVNPVLQVREVSFELLAVLAPRDPIDAGSRMLLEALVRLAKQRLLQVTEKIRKLRLLVRSCFLSDPLQVRGRAFPALSPARVSWSEFSLGRTPSLHRLDGRYPRLRRLLRYYACVRLLGGLWPRLVDSTFPQLPAAHHVERRGASEVSRFPCRGHLRACRILRLRESGRNRAHTMGRVRAAFR